jgi:hypothetical protein
MGVGDSPDLICTQLQQQIACTEKRLGDRIHELEMRLIRHPVFTWADFNTVVDWAYGLLFVFVLVLLLAVSGRDRGNDSDDTKSAPQRCSIRNAGFAGGFAARGESGRTAIADWVVGDSRNCFVGRHQVKCPVRTLQAFPL